jgi:hypothetical protein
MTRWALASVFAAALVVCATASAATPQPVSTNAHYGVTLRSLAGGNWQLYVENTGGDRFINSFNWVPPDGLTINSIMSSTGGRCQLSSGNIACSGSIAPELCTTCEGGNLTVNFTGTGFEPTFTHTDYGGYWAANGWETGNLAVTATSSFTDLPRCAKGHHSTKAKPCTKV